jgi:hypothetical protein
MSEMPAPLPDPPSARVNQADLDRSHRREAVVALGSNASAVLGEHRKHSAEVHAQDRPLTNLSPRAVAALTRTWAAILMNRHPELRSVSVSVVGEGERPGAEASLTAVGKRDVLALPDKVKATVEGSRAA